LNVVSSPAAWHHIHELRWLRLGVETTTPPKDPEEEAARARTRSALRFGG
jgi:hypothetical protein